MAAHNVRYSSDFHWTQPVPIRGFEANHALLRWFFQHSQVAGNWVKFDFLTKSDGELGALRTAVPDLGTLARDLSSFRTILFHISNQQRFTEEQIKQINALIVAWADQWLFYRATAQGCPLRPLDTHCSAGGQHWARLPCCI